MKSYDSVPVKTWEYLMQFQNYLACVITAPKQRWVQSTAAPRGLRVVQITT